MPEGRNSSPGKKTGSGGMNGGTVGNVAEIMIKKHLLSDV